MTPAEKLDYIYNLVRKLTEPSATADRFALGFQKSPQPDIVYVGEYQGHPWYKMSESGGSERKAVEFNFLAGVLSDVEVRHKKSNDYGDKLKLRLQFQCGPSSYSLISGLSTYFSRAVVSGLCALGEDFDFANVPVGIEAVTGDKGKVILPALYTSSSSGGWNKAKCDAAQLTNDDDMSTAVNNVLRPRLRKD